MEHVSGVTGAAPILHDVLDHLHESYGMTWYATPTNIVECWIHPVTGKRLSQPPALPRPGAVREKFIVSNLPPLEGPDDYEAAGIRPQHAVRLGGEYRDWLASGDNWLGDRAVLAPSHSELRILFPPPGTILYLDPDLPQQGRRIVLRNTGSENVQWESDSLELAREGARQVALLIEGRHRIVARDPITGAQANTWVEVVAR
jgi:penicillin-binding protein 1C